MKYTPINYRDWEVRAILGVVLCVLTFKDMRRMKGG